MKSKISILIAFVFALLLPSCQQSADGLFSTIKSKTGVSFEPNKEGTRDETKSGIAYLPYGHNNAPKVEKVKNAIDAYLGITPTKEKIGEFNGSYLSDRYSWEDSKRDVYMIVRWGNGENKIEILLFYTTK
ncbi:MAG TPA: hypothetical protein VGB95_01200 [Chitinophagales bacterium]